MNDLLQRWFCVIYIFSESSYEDVWVKNENKNSNQPHASVDRMLVLKSGEIQIDHDKEEITGIFEEYQLHGNMIRKFKRRLKPVNQLARVSRTCDQPFESNRIIPISNLFLKLTLNRLKIFAVFQRYLLKTFTK